MTINHPNMWEVQNAGQIFKQEMAKEANAIAAGDMSVDTAINICAARVWSAARQYQSEQAATEQPHRSLLYKLLPIKRRA